MAPSNGTMSTPPKLVITLPSPYHSTLQWHHVHSPKVGRHPPPQPRTTSTAPCNGTLVPRPIRQSGSSPSPLLEVRTPIAIAIWGMKKTFPIACICTTCVLHDIYITTFCNHRLKSVSFLVYVRAMLGECKCAIPVHAPQDLGKGLLGSDILSPSPKAQTEYPAHSCESKVLHVVLV